MATQSFRQIGPHWEIQGGCAVPKCGAVQAILCAQVTMHACIYVLKQGINIICYDTKANYCMAIKALSDSDYSFCIWNYFYWHQRNVENIIVSKT